MSILPSRPREAQVTATRNDQPAMPATADPTSLIVEVLSMHPTTTHRSIKAECRIRVGPLTIDGYKVVEKALASRPFVSGPTRRVGEQWEPLINILSPSLAQAIDAAVLAAYRSMGGGR